VYTFTKYNDRHILRLQDGLAAFAYDGQLVMLGVENTAVLYYKQRYLLPVRSNAAALTDRHHISSLEHSKNPQRCMQAVVTQMTLSYLQPPINTAIIRWRHVATDYRR